MANSERSTVEHDTDRPAIYEIRISGRIGSRWHGWFDDMSIAQADNGETVLTGPVVDQAALHGLLRKVRDLGIPLISVREVRPDCTTAGPLQGDGDRNSSGVGGRA